MWMTHSFEPAVRPLSRHHSARVPGRDISVSTVLTARDDGRPVKVLAVLQHRVHCDGQFASDGTRRSLESNPLAEFEAPGPQGAVCRASGQHNRGGFVEKASQMTITAPRQARPRPIDIGVSSDRARHRRSGTS